MTKIIDCKTGATFDCSYDSYSIKASTIVVASEGTYYIAAVSDPETLINPFEIAE